MGNFQDQIIANAQAIQKILDDAKKINELAALSTTLNLVDKTAFYIESTGETVYATLANIIEGFNADSVEEYNNTSLFPAQGVSNKIYIDKFNNLAYRWDSDVSQYFILGSSGESEVGGVTELIIGDVVWQSGLTFFVWFLRIKIDSVEYNGYQSGTVTLDNGDASFDRFDSIIVEDDGVGNLTFTFEKGIAGANPSTPVLDIETQLLMSNVLVKQNATEPSGFSKDIIYDEGVKWTIGAHDASIDTASVDLPINGLISIKNTNVPNDSSLQFTKATKITPSLDSILSFTINLEDTWSTSVFRRRPAIHFYITNGGLDVAGPFVLSYLNLTGFNGSITGVDQIVSFEMALFNGFDTVVEFDGLRLDYKNLNTKTFRLDDIIIINNGDADVPSVLPPIEVKIQGGIVLIEGKQFLNRLEVDDKFRMWDGDRYVVGKILDDTAILPDDLDDDTKIKLVIDNQIF
jgi:hypothetical protein